MQYIIAKLHRARSCGQQHWVNSPRASRTVHSSAHLQLLLFGKFLQETSVTPQCECNVDGRVAREQFVLAYHILESLYVWIAPPSVAMCMHANLDLAHENVYTYTSTKMQSRLGCLWMSCISAEKVNFVYDMHILSHFAATVYTIYPNHEQ